MSTAKHDITSQENAVKTDHVTPTFDHVIPGNNSADVVNHHVDIQSETETPICSQSETETPLCSQSETETTQTPTYDRTNLPVNAYYDINNIFEESLSNDLHTGFNPDFHKWSTQNPGYNEGIIIPTVNHHTLSGSKPLPISEYTSNGASLQTTDCASLQTSNCTSLQTSDYTSVGALVSSVTKLQDLPRTFPARLNKSPVSPVDVTTPINVTHSIARSPRVTPPQMPPSDSVMLDADQKKNEKEEKDQLKQITSEQLNDHNENLSATMEQALDSVFESAADLLATNKLCVMSPNPSSEKFKKHLTPKPASSLNPSFVRKKPRLLEHVPFNIPKKKEKRKSRKDTEQEPVILVPGSSNSHSSKRRKTQNPKHTPPTTSQTTSQVSIHSRDKVHRPSQKCLPQFIISEQQKIFPPNRPGASGGNHSSINYHGNKSYHGNTLSPHVDKPGNTLRRRKTICRKPGMLSNKDGINSTPSTSNGTKQILFDPGIDRVNKKSVPVKDTNQSPIKHPITRIHKSHTSKGPKSPIKHVITVGRSHTPPNLATNRVFSSVAPVSNVGCGVQDANQLSVQSGVNSPTVARTHHLSPQTGVHSPTVTQSGQLSVQTGVNSPTVTQTRQLSAQTGVHTPTLVTRIVNNNVQRTLNINQRPQRVDYEQGTAAQGPQEVWSIQNETTSGSETDSEEMDESKQFDEREKTMLTWYRETFCAGIEVTFTMMLNMAKSRYPELASDLKLRDFIRAMNKKLSYSSSSYLIIPLWSMPGSPDLVNNKDDEAGYEAGYHDEDYSTVPYHPLLLWYKECTLSGTKITWAMLWNMARSRYTELADRTKLEEFIVTHDLKLLAD